MERKAGARAAPDVVVVTDGRVQTGSDQTRKEKSGPSPYYVFHLRVGRMASGLDRLKAELPELCILVASARYLSAKEGRDRDLGHVLSSMRVIISQLLVPEIKDIQPTPEQRSRLENSVYVAETYANGAVQEMNKHANRMREAFHRFALMHKKMDEMKQSLLEKYRSTLDDFDAIARHGEPAPDVFRNMVEEVTRPGWEPPSGHETVAEEPPPAAPSDTVVVYEPPTIAAPGASGASGASGDSEAPSAPPPPPPPPTPPPPPGTIDLTTPELDIGGILDLPAHLFPPSAAPLPFADEAAAERHFREMVQRLVDGLQHSAPADADALPGNIANGNGVPLSRGERVAMSVLGSVRLPPPAGAPQAGETFMSAPRSARTAAPRLVRRNAAPLFFADSDEEGLVREARAVSASDNEAAGRRSSRRGRRTRRTRRTRRRPQPDLFVREGDTDEDSSAAPRRAAAASRFPSADDSSSSSSSS